eukprot:CAMPEP_0119340516 /NCGR_PEP_ID=MMETSP1333-20130426/100539_1 /TAXON_ID=418940 /ORGANISM="Scyphosphaera apsteinii, Strain RCC1455" /LENGTH=226 /DNA_ID=CAMNT_0007352281 /DNA_START=126 /DNA_END=807 /DNA_ORIENTATION=+
MVALALLVSLLAACYLLRKRRHKEELLALQEAEALAEEQADANVRREVMDALNRESDSLHRIEAAEGRAQRVEAELQRVRELAQRERLQMARWQADLGKCLMDAGGNNDGLLRVTQEQALRTEEELAHIQQCGWDSHNAQQSSAERDFKQQQHDESLAAELKERARRTEQLFASMCAEACEQPAEDGMPEAGQRSKFTLNSLPPSELRMSVMAEEKQRLGVEAMRL